MSLLEKVDQVAINKLCPYAQALLKELEPIFKKIDPAKIGEESRVEIIEIKKDWSLYILIEPIDKKIPGLTIYAATLLCVLGHADHKQLVCHKDPASDADFLIKEIIDYTSKYLMELQLLNTSTKKTNFY